MPAPPAVSVIAPLVSMVPARFATVPGALEATLEYPRTSPTSAAVVTIASPVVIFCVNEYAFPCVV